MKTRLQIPSHSAKIRAAKHAQQVRFAKQVIKVDDTWTIRRADELNWEIQKSGKFDGYYGNLIAAFNALLAKMLSEGAQNSLQLIYDNLKGIKLKITDALKKAERLFPEKATVFQPI